MKQRRLSANQVLWLRDIARGVDPWARKRGGAQRGGSGATQNSLFRGGFTSVLGDLTQKGRDYLAALDAKAKAEAGPPARPPLKLEGVRYIGYAARVVDVHRRAAIRKAERAARDGPPAE